MKAIQHTINHHFTITRRLPRPVRARQELLFDDTNRSSKASNPATRLAQSLTHMLHNQIESIHTQKTLTQSNFSTILEDKSNTPISFPKDDISNNWEEFHGANNWDDLLDPINPSLRQELLKYGELAQATYDAFDYDPYSEYCGSCRYNRNKLFEKLSLTRHGYHVTKYIYATSQIDLPRWLEKSQVAETWSTHSNWMGFVAVSDDEESCRIGRRDIVVSWRGTVSASEWYEDFQRNLETFGHGDAKVEEGFLSIYTTKFRSSRYNKSSASEQVMQELSKLIDFYKKRGEEVSLTITGHSLGGALALLNAYEAAAIFVNLPVSVISFAAPRIGNSVFRDELHELGVKILRVVVKQDVVPWTAGMVFNNESLQNFDEITGGLQWIHPHAGVELKLDARASPYLKRGLQLLGHHMLETYLHLLDGYESSKVPFRPDATRDIALVNKECDLLINELRIPPRWYQVANKGLVQNAYGRWVKPKRDPEDIPSPTSESANCNEMQSVLGY
ncbi:phospholipase A1-Igamma1, chloroplastic-like [Chenopodium quinoa]|uniref:Fungal lipase-type domain-containing protein n=1 Tax=Chenopodium quinoa TaxID=63459 RepID=A0A803LAN7_CHEQI|nr:phospholipase A1-Igamma1, chloroplastic-like [Chenopodium quinoa]